MDKNERAAMLCEKYIIGNEFDEKELVALDFTELSMLTQNARASKDKLPLKKMFEEKIEAFKRAAAEKLKSAEKIYAMQLGANKMPLLDYTGSTFVFTDMELCKLGVANFLGKNIRALPQETQIIEIAEPEKYFTMLFLRGIRNIRINEGAISVEAESQTEADKEISNPALQSAMIFYLQYVITKCDYETKTKDIRYLAANLIREILGAKFIVPAKKAEEKIMIPQLCRSDKTVWTPVFTDKFEFAQMYSESEFDAVITDYKGISDIYSKHNTSGIVFNPRGANLVVDDKFKEAIDKFE